MRLSIFMMFLVGAALTTACGVDIEESEATYVKKLTWNQEPGEIQDCHVFKLDNARHVEVNRLQVKFPQGSHHVHIYRSEVPVPDAVFDCFSGIDWTQWSLLVGAQTEPMDWALPEGVTIPLEPHQQLLAQVHWLNSGEEAVEPTIDLEFQTTDYSEQHLGVLFGVNQRVEVQPGQDIRVEHWCPLPDGAEVHAMMGHFHKFGHDYQLTERQKDQTNAEGKIIYQAKNEQVFDFELYQPAHEVERGAGFDYGCGYFNPTGKTVTWGSDTQTQEHCNMTVYYAPAEEHRPTICLNPPSKLKALTPDTKSARPGEEFTFVVQLETPESEDVKVELRTSDATAINVPSEITIPKGQTEIAFITTALRPAPVDISATLAGSTVTAKVQVTGLVISELFYQSATGGSSDRLQWIELANTTDAPIDLSKYSLGAGSTDFMKTRVALPMTIPARGCIVVGGPDIGPANHLQNIDFPVDLVPDLGNGVDHADGVGLFASPMTSLSPTTRPLDVIVYGASNSGLRGPDGTVAPVWPGSEPGGSLRRVTDNVWAKSAAPTPGDCEILNTF